MKTFDLNLVPWGGGGSHMRGAGMLVVSLRGVNFGFWSYLRATDRKYQKSHDRQEISDFILFHLNVPFGELFSKITIKSSTALSFF